MDVEILSFSPQLLMRMVNLNIFNAASFNRSSSILYCLFSIPFQIFKISHGFSTIGIANHKKLQSTSVKISRQKWCHRKVGEARKGKKEKRVQQLKTEKVFPTLHPGGRWKGFELWVPTIFLIHLIRFSTHIVPLELIYHRFPIWFID